MLATYDQRITWLGIFLILLSATLAADMTNQSRELRVPQDFPTIQHALEAAANGDIIVVDSGTYYENLEIRKDVRLRSADPEVRSVNLVSNLEAPAIRISGAVHTSIEGFQIRFSREPPAAQRASQVPSGPRSAEDIQKLLRDITEGKAFWGFSFAPAGGGRSDLIEPRGIVVAEGANAIMRNNALFNCSTCISVSSGQAVIENNAIYGAVQYEFLTGVRVYDAQAEIKNNSIMLAGSAHSATGISLIKAQATVDQNKILSLDSSRGINGVRVRDQRKSIIRGNILFNAAISLTNSPSWQGSDPVVITGNTLLGGDSSILLSGLEAEILQNTLIGANIIVSDGVILIEGNIISNSEWDGIRLDPGTYRVTIKDNRVINNGGWGIALYIPACHPQLKGGQFEGHIQGQRNEVWGNSKGSLCPADYPWPPNFIRTP